MHQTENKAPSKKSHKFDIFLVHPRKILIVLTGLAIGLLAYKLNLWTHTPENDVALAQSLHMLNLLTGICSISAAIIWYRLVNGPLGLEETPDRVAAELSEDAYLKRARWTALLGLLSSFLGIFFIEQLSHFPV